MSSLGLIGIRDQIYKTPPMVEAVFVARVWLSKGWSVLPCQSDSKRLVRGFGPHKKVINVSDQIRYWFGYKHSNIAVLAPEDGLILDFDDRDLYSQFCDYSPEGGSSYTEFTPRGGAHVFIKFYQSKDFEPFKDFEPIKGLELKRFGLVFPSIVEGRRYKIGGGVISRVNLKESLQGFGTVKEPGQSISSLPKPSHGQIELSGGAVAKVKQDWPIRDYLTFFEPKLKLIGSGRWLSGLCPFHHDSHPSLWVDAERDTWGCHACAAHGDVINWHSLRKGIAVKGAITDLIKWSEIVKRGSET